MKKKHNHLLQFIIFLLVSVIIILCAKTSYGTIMKAMYPKKYESLVEKYADEYGIGNTLLYSVIRTESGFDPNSVSSAGARGLTQITEDTFDWLLTKTGDDYNFDDLFTPEVSIKYGALFLSILQQEYAITETVAAAYHAGMGNVTNWLHDSNYSDDGQHLKNIPISDTQHYVNKVMSAMDKYYEIYKQEV